MKIEKIETWLVSKWLTVRVTCDDGTYGVGEGNFWSYADATEVITHRIEDDIRGLDPRDVDRTIASKMWSNAPTHNTLTHTHPRYTRPARRRE